MNNVLILYPEEFKSFNKFSRKISNIVKNLDGYSVTFPNDFNGFIRLFFTKNITGINLIESGFLNFNVITHAVVFDDGEEFSEEIIKITNENIPLRLIKIDITRVINIKKEKKYANIKSAPNYEYIGRGSYWGNPYSMHDSGDDRDEVIRKYKYDFDYEKFPNKEKDKVLLLSGKRLGCFCKPEKCHGDILADYLNSLDDGK